MTGPYDKPKVDAWLAQVAERHTARWLASLLSGCRTSYNCGTQALDLYDQWWEFPLWEKVNALHGLRDLVAAEMTEDIKHWTALARAEDEKCPRCQGKGTVSEFTDYGRGVGTGNMGTCPDCHGSGRKP